MSKVDGNRMQGEAIVVLDREVSDGSVLFAEIDMNTAGEQNEPTIAIAFHGQDETPGHATRYWFVSVQSMRMLCDLVESAHRLGASNWSIEEEEESE